MKQAPDRRRLRREYLRKKLRALVGLGAIVYLGLTFVTLAAAFLIYTLQAAMVASYSGIYAAITIGLFGFVPTFVFALLGKFCWQVMKQEKALADKIQSVPPVTPDLLPADEILVRGSEEPPIAHCEVLLRAAKGVETPKEELLRVSQE
jgi:hypothetical protein